MANTNIQLRKSGITGNTPPDLQHGEVAINYADGKLYYKNDLNQIKYITNQDTFGSVLANGTLILSTAPTDILEFASGENIKITPDEVNKRITINTQDSITLSGNLQAQYIHVTNDLVVDGNISSPTITNIQNNITAVSNKTDLAYNEANSAYQLANSIVTTPTGNFDYISLYKFPTGDYGLITDPAYTGLNDIFPYDMRSAPMIHVVIPIDFGYLQ